MDPGEGADETYVRELREETGLDVQVTRLVGVYTSPDIMVEYANGNRIQPVAFSFEAEVVAFHEAVPGHHLPPWPQAAS